VAPTKWKGLKLLPAAAPSASDDLFRQMCRGLIGMLDPQLAAALPPLRPRRGGSRRGSGGAGAAPEPSSPLRRAVHDDLFVGLINSDSEDDEDWQADLEREQKLQVGALVGGWVSSRVGISLPPSLPACLLARSHCTAQGPACLSPALLLRPLFLQASAERKRPASSAGPRLSHEAEEILLLGTRLGSGLSLGSDGSSGDSEERQQEELQQQDGVQQQLQQQGQWQQEEQGSQAATPLPKRPASAATGEAPASAKAMGAVWELVQCCVGAMPLPPDRGGPRLPRPTAVRWYDARARVALLQVAAWLQVRGIRSSFDLLLGGGGKGWAECLHGAAPHPFWLCYPGWPVLCPGLCTPPPQHCTSCLLPACLPAHPLVACLPACLPQVPARKVSNLELLLTQDRAPRQKSLSNVEEDDWARRMRYLKVGGRGSAWQGCTAGGAQQAGRRGRQLHASSQLASWSEAAARTLCCGREPLLLAC
jgi:hypothetical protein